MLHLTAETLDSASGSPVDGATVSVERPSEARESRPHRLTVGQTDPTGEIDATVLVRWSNEVRDIYTEHPDPPTMKAIVEKPGYRSRETSFQIHALPTDPDQAALLDLGQVNLVAS